MKLKSGSGSRPAIQGATASRTRSGHGRMLGIEYKWIALAVTTLGAFMFAIDSTIVVLALPPMMADLNAGLVSMIWVLMGYSLTSTVALLTFGRLADMFGRVRMFNAGFVVFTIGSVLCGLSTTDLQLIIFRVVQGVGGAMLLANSMAIITEAFPAEERGQAMGLNSVVWALGSIAGPLLGGLILTEASWRWIFWVNLPVGVVGTIAALLLLRDVSSRSEGEKFDVAGALFFSASLVALLLALNQAIALGWTSPIISGLLVLTVIFGVAFYVWNRRVVHPVLDFGLFADQVFSTTIVTTTLQALAMFSVNFLVVYYLEVVQGQSPLTAALALVPLSVMSSVMGPIGGKLSDNMGSRRPVAIGMAFQTLGLIVLSTLQVGSSYLHVTAGLLLVGLGGGLFWAPTTSAAMGAAPPNRLGVAAATLATWRNTGMVVSYALSLAIAAAAVPADAQTALFLGESVHLSPRIAADFVDGLHAALRLSAIICALTIVGWWVFASGADKPSQRPEGAPPAIPME
ncbi:MAG TPA: MFS transporter [Chloroflexota bacterium]|nr:MFS transporter [Chloroflexota bacterium]